MRYTLRATFEAASVELNGDSYLLIKSSNFATLFDGLEIVELTAAPPSQAKRPRQQPIPAASNGHKKTQLSLNGSSPAEQGEPSVSQTFADCVRLALRNVGPASIGDILQDLTDSEIRTDRQKLTVCLATLKKQGDAIRQDDGKWKAA